VRAIAEALGAQAANTLHTALFDEGWVDYSVNGVWSDRARKAAGVFDCEGAKDGAVPCTEARATVRKEETSPLEWENAVVMQGSFKRIAWRSSVALRSAIVDPDDSV
jgi:hypothetical protein